MKYFVAIALIATVASATIVKPTQVSGELAEIQEIIAAINNPSTNPATAAALEEMLLDVLGVKPEPIAVGPAIVDFPVPNPVGLPSPIAPSPVAIVEGPAPETSSAPLVQIILNINQAAAGPVVPVFPVATPEPVVVAPEPVQVVEVAPEPVQVVEVAPEPVIIGTPVLPEPVIIGTPVLPEPVIIGTPILPSPAITLPEELN